MRIELMSRITRGATSRLLPAILALAAAPTMWAATTPIVFAGLEQAPFRWYRIYDGIGRGIGRLRERVYIGDGFELGQEDHGRRHTVDAVDLRIEQSQRAGGRSERQSLDRE